jgi:hypothetical protein
LSRNFVVLNQDKSRHIARFALRAVAVLALALTTSLSAQEDIERTPIVQADLDTALETLKEDPNLATTRQMRTLKWIGAEEEKPKKAGWVKWLAELFGWFAEISQVFVWLLIGLLIALLVLYLVRFTKTFGRRATPSEPLAPTHVGDLDIRPESLPDDVGSAAWNLWQQGEHRNALSLLYRGLLSRLAHVHRVPIRDSSTEGDCLTLAERHLPTERARYAAGLILVWQRAVYGGTDPNEIDVQRVCEQFELALRAPPVQMEARP